MKNIMFAASLALGLGFSGAAFAATTTSTVCGNTMAKAAQSSTAAPTASSTTSMADTSSDMGNAGSGASSASIATGSVDKTGVLTPCAPGTTGGAQTGAVPAPAATP